VSARGASSTSLRGATRTSSSRCCSTALFERFPRHSPRTLRRWQKERLDRFFARTSGTRARPGPVHVPAARRPSSRQGGVAPLRSTRCVRTSSEPPGALTHWMDVLETMYQRVPRPAFAAPGPVSSARCPRPNLWDSSLVLSVPPGSRTLVASHLLKALHFWRTPRGTPRSSATCGPGGSGGRLPRHGRNGSRGSSSRPRCRRPASTGGRLFKKRLGVPWAYQVTLEVGGSSSRTASAWCRRAGSLGARLTPDGGRPRPGDAPADEAWAGDFDNRAVCDTRCWHLFERTPFAWRSPAVGGLAAGRVDRAQRPGARRRARHRGRALPPGAPLGGRGRPGLAPPPRTGSARCRSVVLDCSGTCGARAPEGPQDGGAVRTVRSQR